MEIQTDGQNQSCFTYIRRSKSGNIITIWQHEDRPAEFYKPKTTHITIKGRKIKQPVVADLITGKVYAVPMSQVQKSGPGYVLKDIPVSDYPIVIADRSALEIKK